MIKLAFCDSHLFHVIGESVPTVPADAINENCGSRTAAHQNSWYVGCCEEQPDGASTLKQNVTENTFSLQLTCLCKAG